MPGKPQITREYLTPEQDVKIRSLYEAGLGCKKIMKSLNLRLGQVNSSLKRQNVCKRKESDALYRKYQINDSFFEKIDTPDKAYFLGWMYSDGYNQETFGVASITLNKKDKDILLKLGKLIYTGDFNLLDRKTGPGLFLYSKKISSDLAEKGCYQNKSLTLKFPSESVVPKNLLWHFIRGVFDGDGCFYFSQRKGPAIGVFSIVGSEFMIKSLSDFFKTHNISVSHRKMPTNCWSLTVSKLESVIRVFHHLYNGAGIFLERKKEKFECFLSAKKLENPQRYARNLSNSTLSH